MCGLPFIIDTERSTFIVCASRSISCHVRASNSPLRKPAYIIIIAAVCALCGVSVIQDCSSSVRALRVDFSAVLGIFTADAQLYGFVENYILTLKEKYGVIIAQLGFDRWNALSTVQKLESADDPIECVEIRQHSSVLHAPTKWLKEQILTGNIVFAKNELLEINFSNARCTEDTNLNKYVNKKRSAGKVDMVVSLINAVYLLQQEILNGDCGVFVQY